MENVADCFQFARNFDFKSLACFFFFLFFFIFFFLVYFDPFKSKIYKNCVVDKDKSIDMQSCRKF